MTRRLVLLAIALASGCASAPRDRAHERAAGYAHPEPDPACRGTVRQCLALSGLEQVVVKVGVNREGRVAFLDVLTPDLTPAAALEIRRALEGCVWKPAVGPDGERIEGTLTLAIQR